MRLFSIQTQFFYCWGVFSIKSGEDVLFPILARLVISMSTSQYFGYFLLL